MLSKSSAAIFVVCGKGLKTLIRFCSYFLLYVYDINWTFQSRNILLTSLQQMTLEFQFAWPFARMLFQPFQQIWRLWKCLLKSMKSLYNCRYNYWKKLKTLLQKEKLLVLSNLTFCHDVFKSRLLQKCQNASILGKGLR